MSIPISIVIPLFNKEKSIEKAISSVLSQSYQNFELIIINDGSTDQSMEKVMNFRDRRIKLIGQQNGGECRARNRGIVEAKHNLIAFLDADDEWKQDFLTSIYELSQDFPNCGIFGTSYEMKSTDDIRYPFDRPVMQDNWRGEVREFFRFISMYRYFPFCASSVAVRKSIFPLVGYFPDNIFRGGDLGTWLKIISITSLAYINIPLSVVNLDAENRVCNTYEKPLENYFPITTIEELLREGKISSSDERSYAIDYMARHQIKVARFFLSTRKPQKAQEVLKKISRTKRYRRQWIKYYFYSLLPSWLSLYLVKTRP